MTKKIILIFILLNLITSCGKKGDPVYKESKIEIISQTNLITRI